MDQAIDYLNTLIIGALSASVYFLSYQIREISRRLDILYEVTIESDDDEEEDQPHGGILQGRCFVGTTNRAGGGRCR